MKNGALFVKNSWTFLYQDIETSHFVTRHLPKKNWNISPHHYMYMFTNLLFLNTSVLETIQRTINRWILYAYFGVYFWWITPSRTHWKSIHIGKCSFVVMVSKQRMTQTTVHHNAQILLSACRIDSTMHWVPGEETEDMRNDENISCYGYAVRYKTGICQNSKTFIFKIRAFYTGCGGECQPSRSRGRWISCEIEFILSIW